MNHPRNLGLPALAACAALLAGCLEDDKDDNNPDPVTVTVALEPVLKPRKALVFDRLPPLSTFTVPLLL